LVLNPAKSEVLKLVFFAAPATRQQSALPRLWYRCLGSIHRLIRSSREVRGEAARGTAAASMLALDGSRLEVIRESSRYPRKLR